MGDNDHNSGIDKDFLLAVTAPNSDRNEVSAVVGSESQVFAVVRLGGSSRRHGQCKNGPIMVRRAWGSL